MTIQENLAWCAGIFDGEGCISISCVRPSDRNDLRNPSFRVVCKVTMGHKPTVDKFFEILPFGTVQNHVAKSDKVNASYSWICQSRMAEKSLILMEPYILTKREELEVALEFFNLPDVARGGSRGSQRIDPGLLKKKHELYVKCANLKPRNRFRKTPLRQLDQ